MDLIELAKELNILQEFKDVVDSLVQYYEQNNTFVGYPNSNVILDEFVMFDDDENEMVRRIELFIHPRGNFVELELKFYEEEQEDFEMLDEQDEVLHFKQLKNLGIIIDNMIQQPKPRGYGIGL